MDELAIITDVNRLLKISEALKKLPDSRIYKIPARQELGNVIAPPSAQQAMGYGQMDCRVPIKLKQAKKVPPGSEC